jgi:NTP pyrophosphatase (non-canonical NTP hydrolase)
METDQQVASRFVSEHGLRADVPTRLLDLASEVGELAKESLSATRYGREPFSATPAWSDELGDVYFALLALADASGVNATDALQSSLDKYRVRLARSGAASSCR